MTTRDKLLAAMQVLLGPPEPKPRFEAPPLTNETLGEIWRIRQAHAEARTVIARGWESIRLYERGGGVLLVIILLLVLSDLIKGRNVTSTALFLAVFALVVGAMGALLQSLVTYVLALEEAAEDLENHAAVAEGAASDAQARMAIAAADRIIRGRLRSSQAAERLILIGRRTGEGRASRVLRIALGVGMEVVGAALLGLSAAIAIQGISERLFAEAAEATISPVLGGLALLFLGHEFRTWHQEIVSPGQDT